jgi:TPR repeat protein
MRKILSILLLGFLLIACDRRNNMPDFPEIPASLEKQLAFTCAHEASLIPKRDPIADQLFLRARWLQRKNTMANDPAKYPEIERFYRIAAAYGHDKAMNNLGEMLMRGQSNADDAETLPVEMTLDMIQRGIPRGYFNMGALLKRGYGVEQDEKAALKYYRKAADLGNPDAQYSIGTQLENMTIDYPVPYRIGTQMIRCAADQGHTKAAFATAIDLETKAQYGDDPATKRIYTPEERTQFYVDALKYYHLAAKAGHAIAASSLGNSFSVVPNGLNLEIDEERSRRYKIISSILHRHDYLGATADEIDNIVPLPPAKLPSWNEQLEWVQRWNANVPPHIPDEERIAEMAKAKGLDPATGRPIKKAP